VFPRIPLSLKADAGMCLEVGHDIFFIHPSPFFIEITIFKLSPMASSFLITTYFPVHLPTSLFPESV
jgi:hypothetical protein